MLHLQLRRSEFTEFINKEIIRIYKYTVYKKDEGGATFANLHVKVIARAALHLSKLFNKEAE